MKRLCLLTLAALISATILISCEQQGQSARQRVLEFVRTVQVDSLPNVMAYVDPDSLATYLYINEAYDTLGSEDKRFLMMQGFMKEGEHRRMYTRSQIVVNDEVLLDDTTATVEVSYIDRKSRIQYYTKMALKKRDDIWYIVNLRVE